MRKTGLFKSVYLIFAAILLLLSFSACGKTAVKQSDSAFHFASFRDIPGVTEDEIKAIGALQEQYDHFAYAMIPSSEAFYGDDGGVRGFSALFCEWLAELFDIPFIPEFSDFDHLIAALARNEINFTGSLTPTEQRRKIFSMTTPIALQTMQYFRIYGSPPLEVIAELRPLRYSFMRGTATINLVTPKLSGAYEIVLAADIDEVYRMLKSGEVDAHFDSNREIAFDVYSDVVSADFNPLIYTSASMMTQTPELSVIISIVQKAMDNGALEYLAELHNAGYREYLKHKLSLRLNEEERAFIKERPVVPFAASAVNYPVSFYNEREKQWQGVSFDILREVESLAGLSFELVNDVNARLVEIFRLFEDGQASMMTELVYSAERAENFIWSKTVLMTDYPALISRLDYRNISLNEVLYTNVGLIRGYAQTGMFWEWFPNHYYTNEYPNIEAAFDALDNGEVDVVMARTRDLLFLTNYLERMNFKTNYIFHDPINLSFVFSRNEVILCSIIDKALRLMDTDRIADQWTSRAYDYQRELINAQRPWLIGSSVLLLSALAIVAVLFARNRRTGRQLQLHAQALLDASEAKSLFLATMSHEIRTPLSAIIGMTAIGEKSADMEVKNYTLSRIDDASTHLLGVINDILDMSKIEANKLELSPVEFNFERMLQKVITVINFRVAEKRQKFSVNIDGRVPRLLVSDDQRLAQVITNLLSNAAKFTPAEGEICLAVSLLSKDDGVCEIRVEVADNGIGISGEQQKKLFSAFGQAESGISREYGGTGLGLAISKRIVELMDGRIWIESEAGKGSRFIFTIIVPYGEENPRLHLAPGVKWDSLRVFAVDDSSSTRQYFSDLFDQLGIYCKIAENGLKARQIIEESGGFDIYFTDWHMPGMSGLELTKWIKSSGLPGKVILFSSAELEEVREASLQSGADKCLIKPFLSSTIIDCLNECFGSSGRDENYGKDNEFSGKTLLIVEDIEINREILLSLLEHTGLNIDCAENGEEAAALIEAAPDKYDAVFMDMQMPVMDGLEATRRVRAMPFPQCKDLPIIAMTANVFKDDIENCLAAGMNGHIGKPIDIDEMFDKLRKVLNPGL